MLTELKYTLHCFGIENRITVTMLYNGIQTEALFFIMNTCVKNFQNKAKFSVFCSIVSLQTTGKNEVTEVKRNYEYALSYNMTIFSHTNIIGYLT